MYCLIISGQLHLRSLLIYIVYCWRVDRKSERLVHWFVRVDLYLFHFKKCPSCYITIPPAHRLLTFRPLSPTSPCSSTTTPAVLTSLMALFPGSCEESSRRGKHRLTNQGGGRLFASIFGWGSQYVLPPCLRSNVPPSRFLRTDGRQIGGDWTKGNVWRMRGRRWRCTSGPCTSWGSSLCCWSGCRTTPLWRWLRNLLPCWSWLPTTLDRLIDWLVCLTDLEASRDFLCRLGVTKREAMQ